MSSARAHESVTKLRIAPPDVRLVNWPLRDAPLTSALALALVALVIVVAARVSHHLGMAALSGAVLAAVLWRLWIPVIYEIGATGIVEIILGRRFRIPWSVVRRCEMRRTGVLLEIGDATTRGMQRRPDLRWNRQQRELLAVLEFYLGPRSNLPTASPSTATVPAAKQTGRE